MLNMLVMSFEAGFPRITWSPNLKISEDNHFVTRHLRSCGPWIGAISRLGHWSEDSDLAFMQ